MGIQAALAGGLGVALLERRCIAAGHRLVDDMLPPVPPSELALCLADNAREPVRQLAGMIRDFCETETQRLAGLGLQAVTDDGAAQATATWMTG